MKKKSLLLGLSAVIIISALAVGGTLAYFTSADKADNTFTVGSVAIDLFEHKVEKIPGENGFPIWRYAFDGDLRIVCKKNEYDGVYPGAVLPKDPTIRNTGNNPAYVRMKVTISNASAWLNSIDTTDSSDEAKIDKLERIFKIPIQTDWTISTAKMADDTITFFYNYSKILMPDATTSELFSSVTIPKEFDNAQIQAIGRGEVGKFTIAITAEAIQQEGFKNADEAFSELDNQLRPKP